MTVFLIIFTLSYMKTIGGKKPFAYDFNKEIEESRIVTDNIMQTKIPRIPIWNSPFTIKVSFKMSEFDKSTTPPDVFLAKFREILPQYESYGKIYTDGSKFNEKTASAYHGMFGTRSFRIPDNSTVFTAEVEAIRASFNYIRVS